MKLVRISDVYGIINGSCFNDCVATCAASVDTCYQLMYIGALTFREIKANANTQFWEKLLFSNDAVSNLYDYHGIKLIAEESSHQLALDCGLKQKCIVELRSFNCPWDYRYRDPQSGTHWLICAEYNAPKFQCYDPYYGITGESIKDDEISAGYCRHYRVEFSSPKKELTKSVLLNDLSESIICFSKLVNEFRINKDTFIADDRKAISTFNEEFIYVIANRTAWYSLFLNFCDTKLQMFKDSIDILAKALYKLYRKWMELCLKVDRFDTKTLFPGFPMDLGAQIISLLDQEIQILSDIYASI